MSARKSAEIKKKTGSSNVARLDSAAAQIKLAPPPGLPEAPRMLNGNVEATEVYYNLGTALMKYEQLYQEIDSYTLAMAAMALLRHEMYLNIINDPEQAIISEKKSHCPLDPETGLQPVTLKEHPANKLAKAAMDDYLKCIKALTLDMKGRTAQMVQLSMIRSLHGGGSNSHPAERFFINIEAG